MMDFNIYAKLAVMSAAALGMTAVLTIEGAQAYFTTYVSAGGSQVVNLGAETEIHEGLSNMTKHISVRNTSDSNECFVRVKIFCGGEFSIGYPKESDVIANEDWYFGDDGYIYYRPILAPGEMITDDIVQYILYAKEKGCSMQGTEDTEVNRLQVLANV